VHLTKRSFDLIVTALAIILLSPLYLILTAAVLLDVGAPVLFRQRRPGYKGRPFHINKFRTMRDAQGSGEMSLVGPRPLLMQYLPLYSPEQMRRHDVLPGLTGWAQVHGRNALSWPDKFALDVWYVDHWSFGLDMRIILMTLWKVLKREGISQQGQATVEYFQGNAETLEPEPSERSQRTQQSPRS
jgi:lipopolysaccharide/colanic/teichoic acid biosynthesis glycosyltransferase